RFRRLRQGTPCTGAALPRGASSARRRPREVRRRATCGEGVGPASRRKQDDGRPQSPDENVRRAQHARLHRLGEGSLGGGDLVSVATSGAEGMTSEVATFEAHRHSLRALAYRMLGDMGRAEDIVQEAWLHWHEREVEVDHPKAYLLKIITRLCLNELATAR